MKKYYFKNSSKEVKKGDTLSGFFHTSYGELKILEKPLTERDLGVLTGIGVLRVAKVPNDVLLTSVFEELFEDSPAECEKHRQLLTTLSRNYPLSILELLLNVIAVEMNKLHAEEDVEAYCLDSTSGKIMKLIESEARGYDSKAVFFRSREDLKNAVGIVRPFYDRAFPHAQRL